MLLQNNNQWHRLIVYIYYSVVLLVKGDARLGQGVGQDSHLEDRTGDKIVHRHLFGQARPLHAYQHKAKVSSGIPAKVPLIAHLENFSSSFGPKFELEI
jgi:hypothetical protein